MMQGNISFGREAILSITIYDVQGAEREISCVVDTGFTDYLTLPQSLADIFGLPFLGTVQVVLADGSSVSLSFYEITVLWNDVQRTVQVFAADTTPLLGMSLLYGSRLEMDIVDGAAFIVSPVA